MLATFLQLSATLCSFSNVFLSPIVPFQVTCFIPLRLLQSRISVLCVVIISFISQSASLRPPHSLVSLPNGGVPREINTRMRLQNRNRILFPVGHGEEHDEEKRGRRRDALHWFLISHPEQNRIRLLPLLLKSDVVFRQEFFDSPFQPRRN